MSWTLGLEYLKVLVWPAIAIIAIVLFRNPLQGLIGRISKVGAAGAEVEFGQAEEALRQADEAIEAIESAAEKDISNANSELQAQSEVEIDARKVWQNMQRAQLAEEARRSAIEQVLREGALLGWEWARTGEQKPPHLDITWTAEDRPQIVHSSARQGANHVTRPRRESVYEEHVALALERVLPQALIEQNYRIGKREIDFIVLLNGKKVAIEVNLLQRGLLDHIEGRYLALAREARAMFAGLLIVTAEPPGLKAAARLREAGIEVVKWADSSDDLSLRRSIEGLAER
ncbi:hypothetical protein GBF35_25550 [Nonomuraea phyllanthi]|uniref:hypothetical protein n=1 Tax=Nonomuraea phyllanthi TaxID=2219224 RepID=UPI0012934664|nr:hypothetical protein [Nonomuraea phyllanthi]QFY09566.1 hypothetical protein GBF35_25550 [Nonomuraea phyllanthi]